VRKLRQRVSGNLDAEENAVKTQIWIAVSVYVFVAIVKKRLAIEASLHEILQVLSVTLFEQVPILQLFGDVAPQENQMQFLTR
jgi:hypothetical protein